MTVSDEVGTVTAGKKADITAVCGDALRCIDILRDVGIVINTGPTTNRRLAGFHSSVGADAGLVPIRRRTLDDVML